MPPSGRAATRGIRAPGLGLPGYCKVGTWRGRGRKAIVDVRRAGPAVQLTVDDPRLTGQLLDVNEPENLVTALQDRRPAA